MVLPTKVVFVIGVLLAIAEAVQQYLHIAGWVQAVIAMALVFLGGIGVHALSPSAIGAKIPLHVATVLTSAVAALNALLQLGISMPRGVHVAIGVVLVIASTVGIQVTNLLGRNAATIAPVRPPTVA